MNQHLSDRELAQWLAGAGDSRLSNHVADCEPCRKEGEELRAAVGEFRSEVQQAGERDEFHWSRQRHAILAAAERTPSRRLRWAVSLAMGVAALSTVLLVAPHRRVPATPVSDDHADEQLLLAVQSDLSRTAPQALAPAEVLQQERATMLAQLEKKEERRTTR